MPEHRRFWLSAQCPTHPQAAAPRPQVDDWEVEHGGAAAALEDLDLVRPGVEGVGGAGSAGSDDQPERCFLVGVRARRGALPAEASLCELARLVETDGCRVVGGLLQALPRPHPRTYLGSGKLDELGRRAGAAGAHTLVFDDELSPAQQRALDRRFGPGMRVCDRTALILDIFASRAATREGQLQASRQGGGGECRGWRQRESNRRARERGSSTPRSRAHDGELPRVFD